MNHPQNKQGFTLPLTIILLLFISFLVFSFYEMVKQERIESHHRLTKLQASLELESGVNYAIYRMQQESKPWRIDFLQHFSYKDYIKFSLSQIQDGPYAKLNVFNRDSSQSFHVHTGFIPANRPALTTLAKQTNISLVGNSRIEGGCAIKNGTINYSSNYKMPAGENAFYDTVFIGENQSYFDTVKFYPNLSRGLFLNKYANDYCIFDGNDNIGEKIVCKTVVIQGDSHCENCSIFADRVFIRERSNLQNINIIARTISLKDRSKISGVFFAQDSLEVSLTQEQPNPIKLIVQGKKTSEIQYNGFLNIEELYASDVLLIFMGDNWDETMKGISVYISEKANIQGMLISNGFVDFQGKLKGQMVIYNFGFYEDNSLWRGFLRNGQITGDTTYHPLLPDIVFLGGEASYEY